MGRVLRTSEAAADLDDLWNYIAQRNISAADQLIDKLYSRFLLLAESFLKAAKGSRCSPTVRIDASSKETMSSITGLMKPA